MRLTPAEIAAIRAAVAEVFGAGAVARLFGSRLDDSLRGGDIDLHVETPPGRAGIRDKVKLIVALERHLGERRVDVVLSEPGAPRSLIEDVAYEDGVVL